MIRGSNPLDFGALGRHPGPGDVGLLIAVAVTRLSQDLGPILKKYARAGIPACWVVDGRGSYDQVNVDRPGDSIPLVLDGQEAARIPFDDLLRSSGSA